MSDKQLSAVVPLFTQNDGIYLLAGKTGQIISGAVLVFVAVTASI
ncbi:hypothetical protein ExPEC_4573 [Escherichia coli]|nr:hypothetical protein ExPEC_4573 [Escherichia coli]